MAEELMRRTVRMCVVLEGASWTIEKVESTARCPLLGAGFQPSNPEDYVALEDIAQGLGIAEEAAAWHVRACGLDVGGAELRRNDRDDSMRRARWVKGLKRPLAMAAPSPGPEPEAHDDERRSAHVAPSSPSSPSISDASQESEDVG